MSDFWDWWDTIWSEAIRAHADKGAPAHEAAEGKRRAIARLLNSFARLDSRPRATS